LWSSDVLGQYRVAAGTILGTVAIAIAGFGPGRFFEKCVIVGLGTVVVGWCAYSDNADQVNSLAVKAELEKDIEAYATQPAFKADFLAFLTGRLRDCVRAKEMDVAHCDDLESMFTHIDQSNGTVLYYEAEILRRKGRLRDSDDQLFTYLEADKRLGPIANDDGTAAACTKNGTGHCRQRTAWIYHSLANDEFRRACAANSSLQRAELLSKARADVNFSRQFFPTGFEQRLGTRPWNTADLEAALAPKMTDSPRQCDAPPKD